MKIDGLANNSLCEACLQVVMAVVSIDTDIHAKKINATTYHDSLQSHLIEENPNGCCLRQFLPSVSLPLLKVFGDAAGCRVIFVTSARRIKLTRKIYQLGVMGAGVYP